MKETTFPNSRAQKMMIYSLLTAVTYFVSAKLVAPLSLSESESIFAIWPPTGVALIFLLYHGRLVLPGIFLGAFALNLSISSPAIAFEIAIGNTLGPYAVYWLIQKNGLKVFFQNTTTLIKFIFYCLIGSIITSSFGSTILFINGLLADEHRILGWLVWLFGDLIGFLLLTSVYSALTLKHHYCANQGESKFELILMVALLIGLSVFIFGSGFFFNSKYPIEYLVLFPLMWASIRFKPNIGILFLFLLSIFAILGTELGYSSFSMEEKRLSLILLQFFIFTVILVVLMMAAQRHQMQTALYEKEQLSIYDYLTQIPNRRFLMEHLEQEVNLAERYQHPFSVIMFDIDFFKKINDRFGHLKGDTTLIELTKLVQSEIRKTDVFARIGGEEFMILLPESDLEKAKKLAEKLRESIESHNFSIPIQVTCSFGVIEYQKDVANKMEAILKRVDEKLYQAKKAGRNQVAF